MAAVSTSVEGGGSARNLLNTILTSSYYSRYTRYDLDVYELDENSPRQSVPDGANIILKPHQESMLHRCIQYENESIKLSSFQQLSEVSTDDQSVVLNGAVIGDRVGSGKSYLILALIKSNDITHRSCHLMKSFGHNTMIFNSIDTSPSTKTNILVIPHNIPSQWEKYINDFGCGIKYLMVGKTKVIDSISTRSIDPADYDLVVVTSTFYKHLAHIMVSRDVKVQRLIFDEIDNVMITGCVKIPAMFNWYISASYGNLLFPRGYNGYNEQTSRHTTYADGIRTPGFVKSVFMDLADSLPKELMKIMIVKNRESFVESSLHLPPITNHIIRCQTPVSIRVLNGVVDMNIINALNAGDEETAISQLSHAQKKTENNIIEIMISKYKKDLKNLNTNLRMADEIEYDTEEDKNRAIKTIQNSIKEVTNKINMITDRIHSNEFCAICYDDIKNKTIVECCQNSFCFKCLNIWRSKHPICPMCKSILPDNKMFLVSESEPSTSASPRQNYIEPDILNPLYTLKFDKYKILKKILKLRREDENFRCLIFSGYDTSFLKIMPIFEKLNIKCSFLKGRGDVVKNTVNKYKAGDIQVMLMNIFDYGSGLNLENTSDVILFHKFDSEIEKQVIGRAQRMGRTSPLKVWYLLHENE